MKEGKEKGFWTLMGEYAKWAIEVRKDQVVGVLEEMKDFGKLLVGAGKTVLSGKVEDLRKKAEKGKDEKEGS